MSGQLTGRRAVVTGGATGIGAAITKELLDAGAAVVVVQRTRDELDAAMAQSGLSGRVAGVAADLATASGCRRAIDAAGAALSGLDLLVNNAAMTGPSVHRAVLEMDDEHIDAIVDLNLKAVARCSVHAARLMEPGGLIISLGSVLATAPKVRTAMYGATKAAVAALTKGLALELGQRGVRAVTVVPGDIATAPSVEPAPLGDARVRRVPALGRRGDPADVARVVRFLASDDAAYITGTEIFVDGGFLVA